MEKPKKKKVTITLDENLWESFREHCEANGFKMSTRLNFLISNDLDELE